MDDDLRPYLRKKYIEKSENELEWELRFYLGNGKGMDGISWPRRSPPYFNL